MNSVFILHFPKTTIKLYWKEQKQTYNVDLIIYHVHTYIVASVSNHQLYMNKAHEKIYFTNYLITLKFILPPLLVLKITGQIQ